MFSDLFFPLSGISLNPTFFFITGLLGGLASGMMGISAGIIITPTLIFLGVPYLTAITTQMHNAIGTNFIGFLVHWRKRNIDYGLAFYLLLGGIFGAIVELFLLDLISCSHSFEKNMGLVYIVVLTIFGFIMFYQNITKLFKPPNLPLSRELSMPSWMIYIPFHRVFLRARTEMSVLIPISVGFTTALLTSTLGGGNSLLIIPILSYLIGHSTRAIVGTTFMCSFAITTLVSIIHGFYNAPCDIMILFFLTLGSFFGAHIGVRMSYRIPKLYLGLLASLIILSIALKFAFSLSSPPPSTVSTEILQIPHEEFEEFYILDYQDNKLGYMVAGLATTKPYYYTMISVVSVLIFSLLITKSFRYLEKEIMKKIP